MAQLKKTFYLALRVIILVGLFIAFILTSAEPSIKNFMRERVTIDVSKVETDQLQSPAVTVCVYTVSALIDLFSFLYKNYMILY